jgi:CBS domain-containing protein
MREPAVKPRLMTVGDLMTRDVKTCRSEDSLDVAARIMWDHDCGCVPVVDDTERVVGILTDRDVCMAAYTQNAPPGALRVSGAMSKQVHACRPEDTVLVAEKIMRTHRVRRLPAVAMDGRLVGILSINDLAREAVREHAPQTREVGPEAVTETLAAICEPRVQPQ